MKWITFAKIIGITVLVIGGYHLLKLALQMLSEKSTADNCLGLVFLVALVSGIILLITNLKRKQ